MHKMAIFFPVSFGMCNLFNTIQIYMNYMFTTSVISWRNKKCLLLNLWPASSPWPCGTPACSPQLVLWYSGLQPMVPPLVVLLQCDPRTGSQGGPYSPPTTLLGASTVEILIMVHFPKYFIVLQEIFSEAFLQQEKVQLCSTFSQY